MTDRSGRIASHDPGAGRRALGSLQGREAVHRQLIAVSVGVGLALDWLDNRYNITGRVQVRLDQTIDDLERRIEQGKQNLLERGANALGWAAHELVDLAADAVWDAVRRRIPRPIWQFASPRLF